MEILKIAACFALLLCVVAPYSDGHTMPKKYDDDENISDPFLGDAASDDDTQNDADGGDEEDEIVSNAVIVTAPTNYKVMVGTSVRLECKVSPVDAAVVVQWSKDGVTYFIGKSKTNSIKRFSIDANTTDLIIKDVTNADIGKYKCEILQSDPVSIEHTVMITELPRIISFSASNKGRPVEGSDLLLTCNVTGMPPPEIVWSREGLDGNERLTEKDAEFSKNTALIRNVKYEHSGKYYCYTFNGIHSDQKDLTVTVVGKPRVHVHKTIINSDFNKEAILQCSTHEQAPVSLRWYKDGAALAAGGAYRVRARGAASDLSVTPSADEHFGTFTCEAENIYGKHNKSISLVQSPVIEEVYIEGNKLSWRVHSHQPLEEIELQLRDITNGGEWRSISVPLPEGEGHQFDMVYVLDDQALDAGKYEAVIKVKNQHSWSGNTDPIIVDIEARPEYIQHASVLGGNGYFVRPSMAAVLSTSFMYLLVRML